MKATKKKKNRQEREKRIHGTNEQPKRRDLNLAISIIILNAHCLSSLIKKQRLLYWLK